MPSPCGTKGERVSFDKLSCINYGQEERVKGNIKSYLLVSSLVTFLHVLMYCHIPIKYGFSPSP